jgi:hypothetical protein
MENPDLPSTEKWLMGGSLTLGFVLLGVLVWVSRSYFSVRG